MAGETQGGEESGIEAKMGGEGTKGTVGEKEREAEEEVGEGDKEVKRACTARGTKSDRAKGADGIFVALARVKFGDMILDFICNWRAMTIYRYTPLVMTNVLRANCFIMQSRSWTANHAGDDPCLLFPPSRLLCLLPCFRGSSHQRGANAELEILHA